MLWPGRSLERGRARRRISRARGLRKQTTHKHAALLGNLDKHACTIAAEHHGFLAKCPGACCVVSIGHYAHACTCLKTATPPCGLPCRGKPRQPEAASGSRVRPCTIPEMLSPARGHAFPVVIPWTISRPCCGAPRRQTHTGTIAPTINIHTVFNKALKFMPTGLAEGSLSPTCLSVSRAVQFPRVQGFNAAE